MSKHQIGVIGLAVMGKNLALNLESRGFEVAVYNRSYSKTADLAAEAKGRNLYGYEQLADFTASLAKPRKVLLMVQAGNPTDATIEQLIPLLEEGDIIIDGGNAYFADTERRAKQLAEHGLRFVGSGVSGGEQGALEGPAIMPGGEKAAYAEIEPFLKAISAKVDGDACCTYIGPGGAGHYVKMVHNGIEYGDMQLICEAYQLLKDVIGADAGELHSIFKEWNEGELNSYLIEITEQIFTKTDPETGKPMVEVIKDSAGQKGTGKWTSQNALDLGVPLPVITESVFMRFLSSLKEERIHASTLFDKPEVTFKGDRKQFIELVRKALYASKICSYAQGFAQMKQASDQYNWGLECGSIAMIFRGGCIIRAQFLDKIKAAFEKDASLPNLLVDDYFRNIVNEYQSAWREVVSIAALNGIAIPAFSAALSYFDAYRTPVLPANLLQAQRDFFGAHTFERLDKEGVFHFEWNEA